MPESRIYSMTWYLHGQNAKVPLCPGSTWKNGEREHRDNRHSAYGLGPKVAHIIFVHIPVERNQLYSYTFLQGKTENEA